MGVEDERDLDAGLPEGPCGLAGAEPVHEGPELGVREMLAAHLGGEHFRGLASAVRRTATRKGKTESAGSEKGSSALVLGEEHSIEEPAGHCP